MDAIYTERREDKNYPVYLLQKLNCFKLLIINILCFAHFFFFFILFYSWQNACRLKSLVAMKGRYFPGTNVVNVG